MGHGPPRTWLPSVRLCPWVRPPLSYLRRRRAVPPGLPSVSLPPALVTQLAAAAFGTGSPRLRHQVPHLARPLTVVAAPRQAEAPRPRLASLFFSWLPVCDPSREAMPKRKNPFGEGNHPGVFDYNCAQSARACSPTTRRSDAPLVGQYSRGNKSAALALASSACDRDACRNEAFEGVYTENAARSRASNLCLWCDLCKSAEFPDPLHITPSMLYTISGVLKRSGYRSALTICSIAKLAAIEEGLFWSQELDRAMDRCRLYLKRGMGPPSGAASFPMERAPELPTCRVWLDSGPLFPARAITVGLWWVCREIELGNISLDDVSFQAPGHASLLLPASKSDTSALGTERTLSCICDSHDTFQGLRDCCPVCTIKAQHEAMSTFASVLGKSTQGFPLFPSPSGSFVNKKDMVCTITHAASLLGIRAKSRTGAPSWGGHSLRSGGIKFLGANGVELWRIQALARHSSSATLRYLGTSHLNARPDISRDASYASSLSDMRRELTLLSHEVSAAKVKAPPGSASDVIKSRPEDIVGSRNPGVIDFAYVSARRKNALVHTVDRRSSGWSLCDWPFACCSSICTFMGADNIPASAKRCPECIKREAFPNIEDLSDSE